MDVLQAAQDCDGRKGTGTDSIEETKQAYLDHFVSIIDANRRDKLCAKHILIKSEYETCLSAGRVSHHEQSNNISALGAHL